MKEALQRFAAYATGLGSASKERLLYGPVDNRLPRGSFSAQSSINNTAVFDPTPLIEEALKLSRLAI